MSRTVSLVLGAILVLGVLAYVFLGHGKDQIRNVAAESAVKGRIETVAADAAQTGVAVKGLDLSLEKAEGTLKAVTVDNPKGFAETPAMELSDVRFELDQSSIDGSGPLIIRSLSINAAKVHFESGASGSNLAQLKMAAGAAAEAALKRAADAKGKALGGRLVMIDNAYVRNIRLYANDTKENAAPELARIHLSNIGRAENGVPAALAAERILAAVADAADGAGKKLAAAQ